MGQNALSDNMGSKMDLRRKFMCNQFTFFFFFCHRGADIQTTVQNTCSTFVRFEGAGGSATPPVAAVATKLSSSHRPSPRTACSSSPPGLRPLLRGRPLPPRRRRRHHHRGRRSAIASDSPLEGCHRAPPPVRPRCVRKTDQPTRDQRGRGRKE